MKQAGRQTGREKVRATMMGPTEGERWGSIQEPFFLSSSPSPSNHLESRHLCQHLPRVGDWVGD